MKVGTVVTATQHAQVSYIARLHSSTVGAVVQLAIKRFLKDYRETAGVADKLQRDGRWRVRHKKQ